MFKWIATALWAAALLILRANSAQAVEAPSFSGQYFLAYKSEEDHTGAASTKFHLGRAYVTLKKVLNHRLTSRITFDGYQDDSDDFKVRLKYLYGRAAFPEFGFVTQPHLEFGLAHVPWLDFEESVNRYRMQGTMFMERSGLFNSSDFGVMFAGYLGGEMDDDFTKNVNSKFAGRYGSFALGVYNGGGYHAKEANLNKVFHARLSFRPLPDDHLLRGMQLSVMHINGAGNTAAQSDWITTCAMLSYESQLVAATGQFVTGKGNQSGGGSLFDTNGWSAFVEFKLDAHWRGIGRYESFALDVSGMDPRTRIIAGIGYDFGNRNLLLLDYQTEPKANSDVQEASVVSLTMQINF